MAGGRKVNVPELTAAAYDWFVKEKRFALLYCGARWLGDDAQLREEVHSVAEIHADWMNVGMVDVDDVPNIARRLQLSNVPSVVYFEKGQVIEVITGHDQNILQHAEALLSRMDSVEQDAIPGAGPAEPESLDLAALDLAAKRLSGSRSAINPVETAGAAKRTTGSRTAINKALPPVVGPDVNARPYFVWFWIVLAALTGARVAGVMAGGFDLSFDEAYYWHWSKQMDWCFFSKGPGVAAMIRATTEIAGDGELGVRLGAIVCSTLTSILAFFWAKSFFASARTALISGLLAAAAPIFTAGGMLSTIDAPFFLCWTGAVAAVWWAITSNRLVAWVVVGVVASLGLQCKFTMGFFFASLILFSIISPPDRRMLLRAGFWVAVVVAADSLLPMLLWNSRHDWITFHHNAEKAGVGPLLDLAQWPRSLGEQAAVISPVVFVGVVVGCILCTRDAIRGVAETEHFDSRRARFLFSLFAPIFGFYIVLALHRNVEPNWPVVGYLTAFAATGWYWGGLVWTGKLLGGLIAAIVVGVFMIAPMFAGDALYRMGVPARLQSAGVPFQAKHDPTNRLYGWKELASEATARADAFAKESGKNVFFLADHYKYAAWIGFYGQAPDRVHVTPRPHARNQFDVWRADGRKPAVGDNALMVYVVGDDIGRPAVEALFERVEKDADEVVVERAGTEIRRHAFLRAYGYKGDAPGAPEAGGSESKDKADAKDGKSDEKKELKEPEKKEEKKTDDKKPDEKKDEKADVKKEDKKDEEKK